MIVCIQIVLFKLYMPSACLYGAGVFKFKNYLTVSDSTGLSRLKELSNFNLEANDTDTKDKASIITKDCAAKILKKNCIISTEPTLFYGPIGIGSVCFCKCNEHVRVGLWI